MKNIAQRFARFTRREDGSMTVFALFSMIFFATFGAIAVDYSHLRTVKNELQSAADSLAHAAIYNRETMTASEAKTAALALLEKGWPKANYGTLAEAADIQFGTWHRDTNSFEIDNTARDGVLVTVSRTKAKRNGVRSYLFQFVNLQGFDVTAQAVFSTYLPICLREGFVADGVVDIQSNNFYLNGFCVHSNDHVEFNQNNYFENGTIVSMPDLDDLELPQSGFKKNEGLQEALREGEYRLRILNKIPDIISGLKTGSSIYTPDYIGNAAYDPILNPSGTGTKVPLYIAEGTYSTADLTPGRTYISNCTDTLTIDASSAVLTEVVIIASCKIKFSSGSMLEDVVVATTSTDDKSINAPSGLQAGKPDDCADGGGVQFLTMGGMEFASGLEVSGAQFLAKEDIQFSAAGDGINGVSMVAGGRIDGTSNMVMAFCDTGMEDNFLAEYFRLSM